MTCEINTYDHTRPHPHPHLFEKQVQLSSLIFSRMRIIILHLTFDPDTHKLILFHMILPTVELILNVVAPRKLVLIKGAPREMF